MASEADVRRFGRDIAIPTDPSGELRVTPTGDLATLEGRANANTALLRRVLVTPGAMVHRPGFGGGLAISVGMATTLGAQAALANAIRRTVIEDPRVAETDVVVASGIPGEANRPDALTVTLAVTYRGEDSPETVVVSAEG